MLELHYTQCVRPRLFYFSSSLWILIFDDGTRLLFQVVRDVPDDPSIVVIVSVRDKNTIQLEDWSSVMS